MQRPAHAVQPRPRRFDLVIDALFGFSFSGAPRPPFDALLRMLASTRGEGAPPIASIDIPSGAPTAHTCAAVRQPRVAAARR
jgi:NAD(P)H-hydrate repair Nnr-like enzyme with NAD(P)H-hydrate epimerase domain